MLRLIACNDTSVERVAKARFRVHVPTLPVDTKIQSRRVTATNSVAGKAPAKQEVISAPYGNTSAHSSVVATAAVYPPVYPRSATKKNGLAHF
jgi:hypothetical protein